ncbi:MAG: ABC transporter permease [Streptosporangiales bacterium]|nr:ABC transporter permease [Streptosporangiales bacterium]
MISAPAPTPVIPSFGGSDACVANTNSLFCPSWVSQNWGSILQPELLQHIELTVVAVVIGTVIAFVAALIAFRHGWFAQGFGAISAILYTIPSLAFFEMFVPVTGIGMLTIEIGLVGYTLLILFRNILEGLRAAPAEALTAAAGIGMTPRQTFWKVNVRLALPAIFAGLRVATVTTISLATVAAYISTIGLGAGIQRAIQNSFNTELLATGILTIILALVADALIVLIQRVLTPWQRAARRS